MDVPILQLNHIKKVYPGVVALDDVTLSFYKGEIHAIVGENGAGKSTFIKSITGAIEPSKGEIIFNGKVIVDNNPITSLHLGIGAIYQEFTLVPYLSVAENIYLGRYPKKRGLVDYKKMEQDTVEMLKKLGVDIDPSTQVRDLSVGFQQIVEIARAVSRETKVLIMDEPSAPLTANELKYLFRIVEHLKKEQVTIIYISHRMEEIFEICDKVSVFRDGKYITTRNIEDTSTEELVRLMVNRELGEQFPKKKYKLGEKVLEVKGIHTDLLRDISFSACKGEILGLAGLVGAGRTEIARAIFGADKITGGEIYLKGQKLVINSPKDAIAAGIGLIPEDRKQHGALLSMSVGDNITYATLEKVRKFGFIDRKKEQEYIEEYIKTLNIKTPSAEQLVKNLSGGNQQKVVLAKWLVRDCEVLILDEPTRGIDIGAKQEIYALMNHLVEQGKVVIMISSEMPELLGMADRIIVMHEGRMAGELLAKEATQEKILLLSSGEK